MPRVGTLSQPSPEDSSDSFGAQVRSFREKQIPILTQKALGERLGYSQRWISDVETGKAKPSAEFIKAFEDFCQKPR
jgi:transcriptional regulator with XRE-family HTH domain